MNWLTKINLTTVVTRLGTFRSAVLLLTIIVISIFCGYRGGNYFHNYQIQTLAQQKLRLNSLYQKLVEKTKQINTLEVELEVERMANQRSQEMLKEVEQEHFQVKKKLAFYEKIMAPEKQANGLAIDNVTITKTQSARHYRFQVVLVQHLLRKRYAKGYIDVSISGSLNGNPTTLELSNISTITKKELSFSFQYFQIINGDLTLPENFIAEDISISAVLPKGRWQEYNRVDQSYLWQKIIAHSSS